MCNPNGGPDEVVACSSSEAVHLKACGELSQESLLDGLTANFVAL